MRLPHLFSLSLSLSPSALFYLADPLILTLACSITMPSQVAAPIPISPSRSNVRLVTSQDLFASLNATLAGKNSQQFAPVHAIQENDYTVPAPPPPSPVSFRHEHWPTTSSSRR